jgi:hypothetical protein
MRKLCNKYRKLLDNIYISSSSSISPSHYMYSELKSQSPNDLIKKLRKMKIKQQTIK